MVVTYIQIITSYLLWFLISRFAMHRFVAKTPVAPQQSASGDDSECDDLVLLFHFI